MGLITLTKKVAKTLNLPSGSNHEMLTAISGDKTKGYRTGIELSRNASIEIAHEWKQFCTTRNPKEVIDALLVIGDEKAFRRRASDTEMWVRDGRIEDATRQADDINEEDEKVYHNAENLNIAHYTDLTTYRCTYTAIIADKALQTRELEIQAINEPHARAQLFDVFNYTPSEALVFGGHLLFPALPDPDHTTFGKDLQADPGEPWLFSGLSLTKIEANTKRIEPGTAEHTRFTRGLAIAAYCIPNILKNQLHQHRDPSQVFGSSSHIVEIIGYSAFRAIISDMQDKAKPEHLPELNKWAAAAAEKQLQQQISKHRRKILSSDARKA